MNQPIAESFPANRRDSILARILTVAAPEYPDLGMIPPGAADRERLEAHIAQRFAREYGARIEHFLPYLVSLTVAGEPGAIVGLRPARTGKLFLEQYLDAPVEQEISRARRMPVDRHQVVEIGNLVSAAPGAASLLFGVLPTMLALSGLRWVVCTATPQVCAMLDKLGFPSRTICAADPDVLGETRADWGSYYDSYPQVIIGDVHEALARAKTSGALRSLVYHLRMPLENIASVLQAEDR